MKKLRNLSQQLATGTYVQDCLRSTECRFLTREIPDQPNKFGQKKVIVEFSSPNIAKPFHVGHLRSTLIGRFISCLLRKAGHDVTTINYLGDWGVQFGILARGFVEFGDFGKLRNSGSDFDPLGHLLEVYVSANKRAKLDEEFLTEAKSIFAKMENGNMESLKFWEEIKSISLAEFREFYQKISVDFDLWHGEKMYSEPALTVLRKAKQENKLETSNFVDGVGTEERFVPLARSDGSTLYLTRDVAAVLHREKEIEPDFILYVVETGQERHFQNLKFALDCLGYGSLAAKGPFTNYVILVKGCS